MIIKILCEIFRPNPNSFVRDAYSEPSQISMMELFVKMSMALSGYFRKKAPS